MKGITDMGNSSAKYMTFEAGTVNIIGLVNVMVTRTVGDDISVGVCGTPIDYAVQ